MTSMTSTAAADPDKRAPGRPRSARSEQAIIDAVLSMISEGVAIETLSVESIAARAGVGKATIYRRWSSKEQLVVDAVASLKLPVPEVAGESCATTWSRCCRRSPATRRTTTASS
jgi:hypothetical protein